MIACENCDHDMAIGLDDLARELHDGIHHHMARQATLGGYGTELERLCYPRSTRRSRCGLRSRSSTRTRTPSPSG